MKKPVVLALAVFLTILVLLLVYGCSKQSPVEPVLVPAPRPVVVAPAIQPAVVVAPTPVVPILVVAKAQKKAKNDCFSKAEKQAYVKAWGNAILANKLLKRHAFQDVFEVPKAFCFKKHVGS